MLSLDDVAAVQAGVCVVGLDHVAQQEGGAAVGLAELECRIDAGTSLAREQPEQPDQRQHEEDRERLGLGGERDGESERGESEVDRRAPEHVAKLHPRLDAARDPVARGEAGELDRELGQQREYVDRCVAEPWRSFAGESEHDDGPDRVPGVHRGETESLALQLARPDVHQRREHETAKHDQRYLAEREDEQHRREDQLRRHDRADAHLVFEAGDERVQNDDERELPPRGGTRRRQPGEKEQRDGEERAADDDEGRAVARGQAFERPCARLLEHTFLERRRPERRRCGRIWAHADLGCSHARWNRQFLCIS